MGEKDKTEAAAERSTTFVGSVEGTAVGEDVVLGAELGDTLGSVVGRAETLGL